MQFDRAMDGAETKGHSPQRSMIRVIIAYDDIAAGQRAIQMITRLSVQFDEHLEFRPFPGSFDLLQQTGWADVAANDAVRADILILATSDPDPFAPAVGRESEKASWRKKETASAVMALFGTENSREDDVSFRLRVIERAAREAGLVFFAPNRRLERASKFVRLRHHLHPHLPFLSDLLEHYHPSRRWGINE